MRARSAAESFTTASSSEKKMPGDAVPLRWTILVGGNQSSGEEAETAAVEEEEEDEEEEEEERLCPRGEASFLVVVSPDTFTRLWRPFLVFSFAAVDETDAAAAAAVAREDAKKVGVRVV